MVRRIKPQENLAESEVNSEMESVVYIPTDDETVYVQAENIEDTETCLKEGNAEEQTVLKEQEVMETDGKSQPNKSVPTAKYGVSLYNYSKSTKKPGFYPTENQREGKDKTHQTLDKSAYTRGTGSPPQLSFPHGHKGQQYGKQYYNHPTNKHFQEHGPPPSFYPDFNNRGGGRYPPPDNFEAYMNYRKTKYYDTESCHPYMPPPHHRTSKTSYSRSPDRSYKIDSYLPYDKYRTMANLPPENRRTQPENKAPSKKESKETNSNLKDDEKTAASPESSLKETTENASENTTDSINPPELMRVSQAVEEQGDKTTIL